MMARFGARLCLLVVACFEVGCEPQKLQKPLNQRTQSTRFVLSKHENPSLFFGEREMYSESFGRTEDGREKVKLFTTDAVVAELVRSGKFEVDESVWPGTEKRAHSRETSGGGGNHTRIICPPTVFTRATSDYLWSYPEVAEYAAELTLSPSGMISSTTLGMSQNGDHQIVAVKFGPTPGHAGILFLGVPTIYLIATQHAREWGAAGTAIGLMRELAATIDNPSHRPSLRKILEKVAIVVVPVANPEGYEFTRTTNRAWRGNRNTTACALGVDLNRNHQATWGGSSREHRLGSALLKRGLWWPQSVV